MANDFDTTARNVMLDALGAVAVQMRLHSADPGGANSNSNELTIATYQRKTISWSTAASGTMDSPTHPVFDIPSGATVAYASFWNSGGTVRYWKKAVTSKTWGATGTYTVTDCDADLNDA